MADTMPWEDLAKSAPAEEGPWNDIGGGSSPSPNSSMGLGEMATKAAENFIPSAGRFASDLVQPVMHPIETAKAIGNVGLGVAEKAIPGGEYPHEKYADAVGHYFANRYGGFENAKRTFAEDPVGFLADASMLFSGGETALGRMPGVLGKASEISGTVARTIDPVMAPVNAAKVGAEVVGGLGTHTGAGALKTAYQTGVEGGEAGKAFREEMRGNADMSDVVDTARQGLAGLYKEKADQYTKDMAPVNADYHMLDFTGIDNAMAKTASVKKFKGVDIDRKTAGIRQEINDLVNEWRGYAPAQYHTPAGFDALKQAIGDIMDHTEYGSPARRVAREAYNAVKQEIINQAPEYAKAMKNYEGAMGLIREMEQTLSLKQGANIDTTLRKLQSIMRNNVNANYGRRMELGRMLEDAGAEHLMARLSGQTLNTWMPRGLGKAAAEVGLLGAGAHAAGAFPWTLAAMPFMSPRLMGEASHLAGRTVGRGLEATEKGLGKVGVENKTVGDVAYQVGRIPRLYVSPNKDQSGKSHGGSVALRLAYQHKRHFNGH